MEYPDDIWIYIKGFLIYKKSEYKLILLDRIHNEKMKLANALILHDKYLSYDLNWVFSTIKLKINKRFGNKYNHKIDTIWVYCIHKLLNQINFLIDRKNFLKNSKEIKRYINLINNNFFNINNTSILNIRLKDNNIMVKILRQRDRIDRLFYEYSIYLNK